MRHVLHKPQMKMVASVKSNREKYPETNKV